MNAKAEWTITFNVTPHDEGDLIDQARGVVERYVEVVDETGGATEHVMRVRGSQDRLEQATMWLSMSIRRPAMLNTVKSGPTRTVVRRPWWRRALSR